MQGSDWDGRGFCEGDWRWKPGRVSVIPLYHDRRGRTRPGRAEQTEPWGTQLGQETLLLREIQACGSLRYKRSHTNRGDSNCFVYFASCGYFLWSVQWAVDRRDTMPLDVLEPVTPTEEE